MSYAQDDEQHGQLLGEVSELLAVDCRLPDRPFRASSGHVDVCQYGHAVEGSFGPVVQALADVHGDESLTVVTLDPSPAYYREHYGTYGSFRVSGPGIGDAYREAVAYEPQGDPTGAVTFTADVVAMVGSTGLWSVWAERSWDLALVMSQHPAGSWLASGVPFVAVETALDDFT